MNVKWGKETFKNVEIDTNSAVEDFKVQLYSLTGVDPDRQKGLIFLFLKKRK